MLPPQTTPEFHRKFLITLLTHRFQIALVEFRFLIHLLIANGTGKMVNTPSFI